MFNDVVKEFEEVVFIFTVGNEKPWSVSFFIFYVFYIFPYGTGIGTFPETDRGVVSGSLSLISRHFCINQ